MADHILKATCQTVHLGGFSADLPPALEVQSGDRVEVETYTGVWLCDRAPQAFVTPELLDIYDHLPDSRKVGAGPHLLTGPIYIQDAEPGDVLEVRLEAIEPRLPIGFNAIRPGWGALQADFDQSEIHFIPLDLQRRVAEFPPKSGIQIPLNPFFGILGVATEETSRSSVPPGVYGGNMDNRQLQVGSRVFLPIFLPGGRFSIGDGHSAQGDGEINGTAIETSMNGTVMLTLRKDLKLTVPFAETARDFIFMGFGTTLDEAFEQALQQTIAFLVTRVGLDAKDAYVLCSLAVHFHISQVVNQPQKGVHALLSKSLLPEAIEV